MKTLAQLSALRREYSSLRQAALGIENTRRRAVHAAGKSHDLYLLTGEDFDKQAASYFAKRHRYNPDPVMTPEKWVEGARRAMTYFERRAKQDAVGVKA